MSSARPAGGGSGHIHRHRCRCWRRKHTSAGPPSLTDYTLFSEVSTLAGEDRTSNDDLFQWLSLQLVRVSLCTRFSCKCDVQAAFLWETWRHWKTSLTLASQLTELAAVSLSWIEQHVIAPVSLAVSCQKCVSTFSFIRVLTHTRNHLGPAVAYSSLVRLAPRACFTLRTLASPALVPLVCEVQHKRKRGSSSDLYPEDNSCHLCNCIVT